MKFIVAENLSLAAQKASLTTGRLGGHQLLLSDSNRQCKKYGEKQPFSTPMSCSFFLRSAHDIIPSKKDKLYHIHQD
jgi:hypothetical protein